MIGFTQKIRHINHDIRGWDRVVHRSDYSHLFGALDGGWEGGVPHPIKKKTAPVAWHCCYKENSSVACHQLEIDLPLLHEYQWFGLLSFLYALIIIIRISYTKLWTTISIGFINDWVHTNNKAHQSGVGTGWCIVRIILIFSGLLIGGGGRVPHPIKKKRPPLLHGTVAIKKTAVACHQLEIPLLHLWRSLLKPVFYPMRRLLFVESVTCNVIKVRAISIKNVV